MYRITEAGKFILRVLIRTAAVFMFFQFSFIAITGIKLTVDNFWHRVIVTFLIVLAINLLMSKNGQQGIFIVLYNITTKIRGWYEGQLNIYGKRIARKAIDERRMELNRKFMDAY